MYRILVFLICAVALIIFLAYAEQINAYFSSNNVINSKEKLFDETIAQLKRDGYKISYYNKNTGTITIRHKDGASETISVYKGYNSHYRKTK